MKTTFENNANNIMAASKARVLAYNVIVILAGTLLIAVCAQISVLSPAGVPITAQTFAILLIAAAMGTKRAVLTVVAYIAEGAMGLPVFAPSTAIGPTALVGPTAGYLVGFVAATFIIGKIVEKTGTKNVAAVIGAMIAGSVAIYICGATWLSVFVGLKSAVICGVWPFVLADCVKIALAAALLPYAAKIIKC